MSDIGDMLKKIMDAEAFPDYAIPRRAKKTQTKKPGR
jgi:hypothetical protein